MYLSWTFPGLPLVPCTPCRGYSGYSGCFARRRVRRKRCRCRCLAYAAASADGARSGVICLKTAPPLSNKLDTSNKIAPIHREHTMRTKHTLPAEGGPVSVTGLGPASRNRPSTTPAYYRGRPAEFWLDLFGQARRRAASAAGEKPSRERGDVPSGVSGIAFLPSTTPRQPARSCRAQVSRDNEAVSR